MKFGAVISCVAVLLLAGCEYFHHEAPVEQAESVSAAQPATIAGAPTPSDANLSAPPPMNTTAQPANTTAQPMSGATATTAAPAAAPAATGDSAAKAEPKWKMHIDERPLICNNNGADSCDEAMHR